MYEETRARFREAQGRTDSHTHRARKCLHPLPTHIYTTLDHGTPEHLDKNPHSAAFIVS